MKIKIPQGHVLEIELSKIKGSSYCAVFIKSDAWHIYLPCSSRTDKSGWKWVGKCFLREKIPETVIKGHLEMFQKFYETSS